MNNNKKYDLSEMTFLIPIRLDTIIRLENLIACVKHLKKYFKTNIMVLHADSYDNGIIKRMLNKHIDYIFIENHDSVFYRTQFLNKMTLLATTPFVGIWDADAIVSPKQIIESFEELKKGAEISHPYDGRPYDTSGIIRAEYYKTLNINLLEKQVNKMLLIYGNDMKGAAILVNRQAYIDSGIENEEFYGWGPEDFERYERWKILGYRMHRAEGPLFHLTHSRGMNSQYRSMQQAQDTNNEFMVTKMSSKKDIEERVAYNKELHNLLKI